MFFFDSCRGVPGKPFWLKEIPKNFGMFCLYFSEMAIGYYKSGFSYIAGIVFRKFFVLNFGMKDIFYSIGAMLCFLAIQPL